MANDKTEKKNEKVETTAETSKKTAFQDVIDDEFEDFPPDGSFCLHLINFLLEGTTKDNVKTDKPWADSWDDEDLVDDFAQQLSQHQRDGASMTH
jgi:hypothetical protein